MAFVQLDGSNNVIGIFANPQPQLTGYTIIADNDSRITTFNNGAAVVIPDLSVQLAVALIKANVITTSAITASTLATMNATLTAAGQPTIVANGP